MAHNPEIRKFIQENSSLFWWVKPDEKTAVLNHGDEKSVKRLFNLIGIEKVAEIFNQQISRPRSNYHRRTKHFFKVYFERHAQ